MQAHRGTVIVQPRSVKPPSSAARPAAVAPRPEATPAWTLNRFAIVLACLLSLLANLVYLNFQITSLASPESIPLIPGLLGLLLVLVTGRPWALLTGGILNALFPLLVLFVFGGITSFFMPDSRSAFPTSVIIVFALVLALWGGIRGFRRTRKRLSQLGLRTGWKSHAGAALSSVIAASLMGALTVAYIPNETSGSAPLDLPYADHLTLVTKNTAFSPKSFEIHAANLTELVIDNQDGALHTFTYVYESKEHSYKLYGGTETHVALYFSSAGIVKFRCVPHSSGYDDTDGMVGSITVVA